MWYMLLSLLKVNRRLCRDDEGRCTVCQSLQCHVTVLHAIYFPVDIQPSIQPQGERDLRRRVIKKNVTTTTALTFRNVLSVWLPAADSGRNAAFPLVLFRMLLFLQNLHVCFRQTRLLHACCAGDSRRHLRECLPGLIINPSAWGHLNPSSYCDVGRLFYGVFKLWCKLQRKKWRNNF